jgi:2'-5' RNA ligase
VDVDRARLFVAVWPPDDVLDALAALPRVEEPGVRYTTRAQWHVTLRFLGSCAVGDALAAFEQVRAEPCVVVLGPAVSRLGRDVVVVPVRGLEALAAAVVQATAEVGEPPDPRPFTGHLTVARLRHRGACRVAGAPIRASFPVEEIALVRSHTGDPGGSRYETVARRRIG